MVPVSSEESIRVYWVVVWNKTIEESGCVLTVGKTNERCVGVIITCERSVKSLRTETAISSEK